VNTPEEFAAYLKDENERWARIIREKASRRSSIRVIASEAKQSRFACACVLGEIASSPSAPRNDTRLRV